MNRHEWKTLWRYMRSERRAGKIAQTEMVKHGCTYWTVRLFNYRDDKGLHVEPAIIRDRSPMSRITSELYWAKCFRIEARAHKRNGSYWAAHAANSVVGAKACIADSRAIRLNASVFHTV